MTIFFVILAGFLQASLEFIRRILPVGTSSLAVATIISLSGGFLGLCALAIQGKWEHMTKSTVGLSLLGGIVVLLLDVFLVSAYTRGLKLNVGLPLFLAASVIFGVAYSIIVGEKTSWTTIIGAAFVVFGATLITTFQK